MSNKSSPEYGARTNGGSGQAMAGMISMNQSLITGGIFNQTNVHHAKGPLELLQDQVAHSAFHNSAQRIDAPRCHPNTRTALKEKAYRWIMRTDAHSANAPILWLNGPAGAGKSAIAQSIAEHCHAEKLLLASFFFNRSDPARNHATHFVATVAYQIYQIVPPSTQHLILEAVQRDTLLWTRDLFTQFHILVVNTLRELIQLRFFDNVYSPRLLIIDGLDECIDQTMQQRVLDLLLKAVHEWRLPFLFLVASRPEPDIQVMFQRPLMLSVCHNVSLEQEDLADPDIQLFIQDKLDECRYTHPLRRYIPSHWPSDYDVASLVRKSSGQFIYASVVIKYVTSTRHHPHKRLQTILELPPTAQLAYSELDAVYSQILLSVEDLPLLLRIFGISLLFEFNVDTIEAVLHLEEGDVSAALSDVNSLVSVRDRHGKEVLHFHHASLEDYLFDASRSRGCHIDRSECFHQCTKDFIFFMMGFPTNFVSDVFFTVFLSLPKCLKNIDLDSMTSEYVLFNFSLSSLDRRLWTLSPTLGANFYSHTLFTCFSEMLDELYASHSLNAPRIIQHLIHGVDEILTDRLNRYHKSIQFDFNRALIVLANEPHAVPRGALHRELRLDWRTPLPTNADDVTFDFFQTDHQHPRYGLLISDYFSTPHRSNMYAVDAQTCAHAAIYCLQYLCNHSGDTDQIAAPALEDRLRLMRSTRPWRWRWRRAVDKARGWRATPLMWVVYFWNGKQPPVLRPRKYRALYAHEKDGLWALPACDPLLAESMLRSERYWLALHYLPILLSRAERSNSLVYICKTKVFAWKSQDFPLKSRKARAAMNIYLERVK